MKKRLLALCLAASSILSTSLCVSAASVDDTAATLRDCLENRQSSITVYHTTIDENYDEIVSEIANEALNYTGDSTEGDYIKYHLSSNLSGRIVNKTFEDGECVLEIKYSPRYLSTASQEQDLDEILNEFYSSLDLDNMSDYDKLKAVYDYICDNVAYGYQNSGAYSTLANGNGNCRGYALLFYRMALDLGFDARIVSGKVVGGSYNNYHEWNIVKIGSKYYNVDVNFGDNAGGQARYTYFLKGADGIFKDGYGSYVPAHVRDVAYDNYEFNAEHPMSATDFDKNKIEEVPTEPEKPTDAPTEEATEPEVPVETEAPTEETTDPEDEIEKETIDDNENQSDNKKKPYFFSWFGRYFYGWWS